MGLLDDISSGIGSVGMTLAGGDPGYVDLNDQQKAAIGNRALLNMGLSMLMNSGPSYTPHSLGQVLAAGMLDAQRVPDIAERTMLANQATQQEMDIKKASLGIQTLNAQRQLEMLRMMMGRLQGGQAAASDALTRLGGGTGGAAAPGAAGYPYTGLAPVIVGAESGGDVNAKNPKSSAAGPGQFLDSTWQGFLGSPEGKGYTMADRSNPEAVNKAIAWNAGQNDQVIRGELGRGATDDELLASHLLGGKSVAAMAANPTANLGETLTTTMGKETAGKAFSGNASVIRPDMTNAEGLAAATGFYRRPRGVQYASRNTGTATDATPGPVPATPAAPAPVTRTETETGLPVVTAANTPGPATAQPGGTTPALSTQPAQPPAPTGPAPDTPEIAAARAQAVATARARLQAIQKSGDPNAADKVAEVEKDLQTNLESLNKEARDQQYKIQAETRANVQKQTEQERQSALEAQRAESLARLQADLQAKQSAKTATLNYDTKQLENLSTKADSARNMIRDTQPLAFLAQRMGPANALADTTFGKQLRDTMVTLGLGTQEQLSQMTSQQMWDRMIGGLFQDTHVSGMGQQSDREGEWLMKQWGSASQSPDDRLTQLAIVRKLAEQRVQDHADADELFRRDEGLGALRDRLKSRGSVFDRPPAWNADDPNNAATQQAYALNHAAGEPFRAWWRPKGGGAPEQRWTRRKVDGTLEPLAAQLPGGS